MSRKSTCVKPRGFQNKTTLVMAMLLIFIVCIYDSFSSYRAINGQIELMFANQKRMLNDIDHFSRQAFHWVHCCEDCAVFFDYAKNVTCLARSNISTSNSMYIYFFTDGNNLTIDKDRVASDFEIFIEELQALLQQFDFTIENVTIRKDREVYDY